jgi:hypothetical protein
MDTQLVEQLMNPGQAWVVASRHSNVDAQDYNTRGPSECAELPNAARRDELCREFTWLCVPSGSTGWLELRPRRFGRGSGPHVRAEAADEPAQRAPGLLLFLHAGRPVATRALRKQKRHSPVTLAERVALVVDLEQAG